MSCFCMVFALKRAGKYRSGKIIVGGNYEHPIWHPLIIHGCRSDQKAPRHRCAGIVAAGRPLRAGDPDLVVSSVNRQAPGPLIPAARPRCRWGSPISHRSHVCLLVRILAMSTKKILLNFKSPTGCFSSFPFRSRPSIH